MAPRKALEFRTERYVLQGLEALGHEALQVGIEGSLAPLDEALREFEPRVVLNLVMEVDGRTELEPNVAAYLELCGVPYTGCGPRALMLARDKALTKQVLEWHDIPTPEFFVLRRGRTALPRTLEFPLIVKPACSGGSMGIAKQSVVKSRDALKKRVETVLATFGGKVVVERYIAGREMTVGLLGNARPEALPVRETFFDGGESGPRIATWRGKWDLAYRERSGIRTGAARRLPARLADELATLSTRAFQALGLSGFARVDFRVDEDGRPWIIEVNPNPDLDFEEELALAAKQAGMSGPELLRRVINLALRRKDVDR